MKKITWAYMVLWVVTGLHSIKVAGIFDTPLSEWTEIVSRFGVDMTSLVFVGFCFGIIFAAEMAIIAFTSYHITYDLLNCYSRKKARLSRAD